MEVRDLLDISEELALRTAVFTHLEKLLESNPSGALSSEEINAFTYGTEQIRLIVQNGIRKLQRSDAALTIRTTYTPPSKVPPYVDTPDKDGMVRYKYQGTDPDHHNNRGLRNAMEAGLPLAYFLGIAKGIYLPIFPVYLMREIRDKHEFVVGFDKLNFESEFSTFEDLQRSYSEGVTKTRLHQPLFRVRVLHAYETSCAICKFRHPELLDAAHIIPDGQRGGEPIVTNGLALCKIHHAAYDNNLLGINSDGVVKVQGRLLSEVDGPMLLHGFQEVNGAKIYLPRERAARPDRERLAERFEQFQRAG